MSTPIFDNLVQGLRVWAADHDPCTRAAVELLIDHGHWKRNPDFLAASVDTRTEPGSGFARINFERAAVAADRGLTGSTTERGILEYAIALGIGRNTLTYMDAANARRLAADTLTALGLDTAGVR